jgi:hypothetical protein
LLLQLKGRTVEPQLLIQQFSLVKIQETWRNECGSVSLQQADDQGSRSYNWNDAFLDQVFKNHGFVFSNSGENSNTRLIGV